MRCTTEGLAFVHLHATTTLNSVRSSLQRLVGSEAQSPDLIQLRPFFLSVKYLVGMATVDKAEMALVKHRS